MVESILNHQAPCLKREPENYQTAYELLSAKLQQAQGLSEVLSGGDLTDQQTFRLVWCVADLLDEACKLCDSLSLDLTDPA